MPLQTFFFLIANCFQNPTLDALASCAPFFICLDLVVLWSALELSVDLFDACGNGAREVGLVIIIIMMIIIINT